MSFSLHASSSFLNKAIDEPRRNKRQRVENSFGPDFVIAFLIEINDVDKMNVVWCLLSWLRKILNPIYNVAVTYIDANFWKEAIKSELDSIMFNHTLDLVELPKGCKSIKCKRIFRKKLRTNEIIDKFKIRLVVAGYTQKKDIDFFIHTLWLPRLPIYVL